MSGMMKPDEYMQVQTQLTSLSAIVVDIDIESALEAAERAESFAPIVDPTLWKKGSERLDAMRDLFAGALRFKQAALKFRATMQRIQMNEAASERRLAAATPTTTEDEDPNR